MNIPAELLSKYIREPLKLPEQRKLNVLKENQDLQNKDKRPFQKNLDVVKTCIAKPHQVAWKTPAVCSRTGHDICRICRNRIFFDSTRSTDYVLPVRKIAYRCVTRRNNRESYKMPVKNTVPTASKNIQICYNNICACCIMTNSFVQCHG